MTATSLRADCARCAALCCASLVVDQGLGFALDKQGGERCPHLLATDRCAIYAERAEHGMAGCIRFDCYGAGQRVTRMLERDRGLDEEIMPRSSCIGERARRAGPVLGRLRKLHEELVLLGAAERLELPQAEETERRELVEELEALGHQIEHAGLREDPSLVRARSHTLEQQHAALQERLSTFLVSLRQLKQVVRRRLKVV